MAKVHEDKMHCCECGEESEALNDNDQCPDCETWLVIQYHCPECDVEWTDEWYCACDSECPKCGHDIEAMTWEDAV